MFFQGVAWRKLFYSHPLSLNILSMDGVNEYKAAWDSKKMKRWTLLIELNFIKQKYQKWDQTFWNMEKRERWDWFRCFKSRSSSASDRLFRKMMANRKSIDLNTILSGVMKQTAGQRLVSKDSSTQGGVYVGGGQRCCK